MIRLPLLLSLILILPGCLRVPVLYAPPSTSLPMSMETGRSDLGIQFGANGVDLQTGYSPIEHLHISALGSYFDRFEDSLEHARHTYGEIGAGYHGRIGESVTGSVTVGVGFGEAAGFGEDEPRANRPAIWMVSGSYNRQFIQLAAGYAQPPDDDGAFDVWEFGAAFRVAWVGFPAIEGPDPTHAAGAMFIEPVAVMRYGLEVARIEFQYGFTVSYGQSEVAGTESFTTIGLRLSLNDIFQF